LVTMRLIQGLCISGEGAGAAIFILESYQNLRPGFTAGVVQASNLAGTLLATFIGIILTSLPNAELAWRLAFMLGGVMGIVGFYFRLRVSETPIFLMLAEKKKTLKSPFLHVLQTAKKAMFITFCLGACASSSVYLVKAYITIYHSNVLHFDDITTRTYLAYATVIMMITMPLSGYISDHIGKLRMITYSAIAIVLLILPALLLLSYKAIWAQLIALTTIALLGGSISGTAYIFIISLFTPDQRFTGVAFSYNLGVAMFGGTTAIVSLWLLETTGLHYAPAFYIMLLSSLLLLVLYFMRRTIRGLLAANLKKL
jgi:MFS transporter, MHS family, proline/betaine transporter